VSQQPANRAHVSFPQDWDNATEEERKAACLAMADQMTAGLSTSPSDEPQGTRPAARSIVMGIETRSADTATSSPAPRRRRATR